MNNLSVKNLKKFLFSIFMFVLFIILGNITSNAAGDLFLNNLTFEANVNVDGTMDVTETWDIDIENTNTLYKVFTSDSSRYSGINNVQVTEITGGRNKPFREINRIMYHVTEDCYYGKINSDGNFEIAWGAGMEDQQGEKIYQIKYTVEDAVAKYNDYAQLYWQFVGDDFEISAKNVSGTIKLPYKASNKDEIKVWGHTEDLNGEIYATDVDTIEFNVKNYRKRRFIEIRTLFPTNMIISSARGENKDILDDVIQEETIWANEANQKRDRNRAVSTVFTIIAYAVAILISAFCIRKALKAYKEQKESKKYVPEQKLEYYRELPRKDATPAQAIKISKELKTDFLANDLGKIVSSTLLDLNLKKYIDFKVEKEKKKETITIEILNEDTANLYKDEQIIFDFLKQACKGQKSITVKELKKYISTMSTYRIKDLKRRIDIATKAEVTQLGLYDKEKEEKYTEYNSYTAIFITICIITVFLAIVFLNDFAIIGVGAAIIIAIGIIISIILMSIAKRKMNVFTQEGINEKEQWNALKKFMEDFSMLDKKELPEIALWEHFLVYATAFGIADKVLKQLKIVYPDIEQNFDINTYTCMYIMLHTDFTSGFSNAISSSMSSAYSSATGGGGGFSGGGGGGRRTEVAVVVDNQATFYTI